LTIGGHSEYFIGTHTEDPSNLNDENSIAKLGGINIIGTEYILYDHQNSSNDPKQSAAIIYVSYEELFFCFLFNKSNQKENFKQLNKISKN
jgi:hypothetical protein